MDLYVVDTLEHANRKINVCIDPEPFNPRKEYDNATVMVCWHRRYNLGDEQIEPQSSDELKEAYAERGDPILAILPLYLYDHSGLSMRTGAFSCSWDSGQVGWIFIPQSKVDLMGFVGYTLEQYENVLRGEVETYDAYLTGEVYGYQILGMDDDVLESCWGYFDQESCWNDAKDCAGYTKDPCVQALADELASRATYAGA
jgi:hypothetical protein